VILVVIYLYPDLRNIKNNELIGLADKKNVTLEIFPVFMPALTLFYSQRR
jgi:hypothetical protein